MPRSLHGRHGPATLMAALAVTVASVGLWVGLDGTAHAADTIPAPDHTVVVVLENHPYDEIIGSADAPYLNSLKAGGADLTQSHAITHPSQPNYYALFSGSTQGVTDDTCVTPGFSSAPNLASEVVASGGTWASYNETLPSQGSTVCSSGDYAQKHSPWFGFSNVPTSSAKTMAQFPSDYTTLPKMSFVTPNLCSDMHNCSVATGDTWIKNNLGAYATWAAGHNSMLVVTFDEDDSLSGNRIPTLLYGQPVAPGSSTATAYTHYDLLRTLEDLAGTTAHAGQAATASDITGIWADAAAEAGPITSGLGTGKCVDVAGGGTANGTKVQLLTCDNTAAQRWTVGTDGTVRVFGKCLTAAGSGTAQGTKAQLYDCDQSGGQQWVALSGTGALMNKNAGRCLDSPSSSTADGTQLQLWDCNGTDAQRWILPAVRTGPVTSAFAGMCVDDKSSGTANGTPVQLWTCNGSAAQRVALPGDGSLQILGKCVATAGDGTGDHTKVELSTCDGGGGQKWVRTTGTGALVNPRSGRCLDVPGSATVDGTQLQLYHCNGTGAQRWTTPS